MSRPVLPLAEAMARGPVVLDGGLSNQLEAQGCDLSDEMWSARLLADAPEEITAAHRAYVRAGARVLITGSYQASFEGLARRGCSRTGAAALFRRSVRLAREAAGEVPVHVAASVGPYGAVLADGSEYRGRYGLSVAELERFHRPRVEAVAEAGPDVLALETVPDTDEAEALLTAAEGTGIPVWLSYTIAGDRTRAGQPLAEAFDVAAGRDQVVAVGVNCCTAEDAERAIGLAAGRTGMPVVVYPNSGERWDAAEHRWHGAPTLDPRRAPEWAARGARLIGGCCRAGPPAIRAIAEELSRAAAG